MVNADMMVSTGDDEAIGVAVTNSNGKTEYTGRFVATSQDVAVKGIYENR